MTVLFGVRSCLCLMKKSFTHRFHAGSRRPHRRLTRMLALNAALNPADLRVKVTGHEKAAEGHNEYVIRVELAAGSDGDGTSRVVSTTRRRYSEFLRLHEDCFHLVGGDFPAHKALFTTEAVVRERAYLLGKYLKNLLTLVLKAPAVPTALMHFLELPGAPAEPDPSRASSRGSDGTSLGPGASIAASEGWSNLDCVSSPRVAEPDEISSGVSAAVANALSGGALHNFRLPELRATVIILGWGKVDGNPNTQYDILLSLGPRGGSHKHLFTELHSKSLYGLRVKRHYDHLEWLDKRLRSDERLRKRMVARNICLPQDGRPRRPTDPSSWFTSRPDAGARAPALRDYLQARARRAARLFDLRPPVCAVVTSFALIRRTAVHSRPLHPADTHRPRAHSPRRLLRPSSALQSVLLARSVVPSCPSRTQASAIAELPDAAFLQVAAGHASAAARG